MKIDCNVLKGPVEAAFNEYIQKRGTDQERFKRMKINFNEKDALWRLWILALMYQAMSEKASEKAFTKIQEHDLTFNPSGIFEKSKKCDCPFLSGANKVHFCDLTKSMGCSERQFFKDCPVQIIRDEICRLSRISRAIVSSAIYLRYYDFSFEKLYASLREQSIDDRTQRILDMCTVMGGEKVSHMYLRWVSNSVPIGNWKLDTKKFLAIDVNIRRVAENIGLCKKSQNTNVIRAHVRELLDTLNMNAPKDPEKMEIALLHVGQKYCKKRRNECDQAKCPFYNFERSI